MLSVKQENFCNFYIETGNASEAYRRAYAVGKIADKLIWEKASRLLNSAKVKARVKELQGELKKKSDITKERVMEELASIAFSSIADMHNSWIERAEFDKLTTKQKSAIKSISTKIIKKNIGTKNKPEIIDVEYVKIELYDKIKAIERVCKILGWDSPIKTDITSAGERINNSIEVEIIDKREDADKDTDN